MMDINFTLIGQILTFVVFIWFTLKYVWPPITKAMQEREQHIADGLAAADKGQRDLELATHKSVEILQEAKINAARIVDQANKRGSRIIEESKESARQESQRLIDQAYAEIEQHVNQVKRDLQKQAADLALIMAEKIVQRDIDANTHKQLLAGLVTEIE
jgi:F-type H+-transporting ATPase subunit b